MRRKDYTLYIDRQSAILYLAAEVGYSRVKKDIDALSKKGHMVAIHEHHIIRDLAPKKHIRKRDLRDALRRIDSIVGYQRGRLGQGAKIVVAEIR